ncbi:hypothetical protein QBC43DRAFT_334318 [Cladorrhinum sp. PSN259]|nr:hypothetical protein QBC43DRAFT_334318 [Cladorrhinum sp. PSN259]
MKLSQITLGALSLLATSNAYVVKLYSDDNCQGTLVEQRNVYDNTCAYTKGGFRSYIMITGGGTYQRLDAYEPQACAGKVLDSGCAQGVNQIPKNQCFNLGGTAHALSSYSDGGDCPR